MEWIKVSERLPEESMRVIVTRETAIEHLFFCQVCMVDYYEDLGFVSWHDDMVTYMPVRGVTAWMPVPKAYKE